jgi:hypothetical protein
MRPWSEFAEYVARVMVSMIVVGFVVLFVALLIFGIVAAWGALP